MLTTDLALRFDPAYGKISKHFLENPEEFEDAYRRAWFKLTHRDLGPRACYLGPEVPSEELIWQDPVPSVTHELVTENDINHLKQLVATSGLTVTQLASTAWASASTYRGSDRRGGANGARVRLSPQKYWEINQPLQINVVIEKLEQIKEEFNTNSDSSKISLADLIVLAGGVGVEQAAKAAGQDVTVPFVAGRTDASQDQTDVESFAVLEPTVCAFRNFRKTKFNASTEELMIDSAQLLGLTAPELTALIGGLRVLDMNADRTKHGVFTSTPGSLTNDFFVNLLDFKTKWSAIDDDREVFEGKDINSGEVKWTATRADLIFGSNSELRAIAEVYGCDDGKTKFVTDFVHSWVKVMNADRFDLN